MTVALHTFGQRRWCHHYDLSVKVSDTALLIALRAQIVDHRGKDSGVNGHDVSVKVARLSGLYMRSDERNNYA